MGLSLRFPENILSCQVNSSHKRRGKVLEKQVKREKTICLNPSEGPNE